MIDFTIVYREERSGKALQHSNIRARNTRNALQIFTQGLNGADCGFDIVDIIRWSSRVTMTTKTKAGDEAKAVEHRSYVWTGEKDAKGREIGYSISIMDSYGRGFFASWQRMVLSEHGAKYIGQQYKGFYCPTLDAAKADAIRRAGLSLAKLTRKLAKED